MLRLIISFLASLLTLIFAIISYADPIQDISMQNYNVGWYPNFYQGQGPLTCRSTCAIWVSATPESELTKEMTEEFERTNVCKITRNPEIIEKPYDDPLAHWLYGNQFDDKANCYAGTPFGVIEDDHYMCLCVCDKPDLIVSKIHDPIWDSGSGQSLIAVDITNVGQMAATASFARLIDPDTLANDVQAIPALAVSGTITLIFTLNYWVFDPDAVLEVTADYKNIVEECDETNNTQVYKKQG
jgi:hypothetical protein